MGSMPARSRATKIPSRVDVTALSDLRRAEPELAATPQQLCVSSRNGRRFVSAADCRLVTGSYPIGSFYRLSDGALLASPELAFLQMARELDFDLLVLYGHELCGYFASQDPGFVNCPPLTSAARIAEYLDRLEALRQERGEGMPWGLGPARRALRHIRDHAASPEEAVVSMVLTLPCRLGGYGLPPAALNERVRLSAEAARLFGIDSFVCDLSWDGGRVLEYQGSQHKIRSRRAYDMRKTCWRRTAGPSSRWTGRCSQGRTSWTRWQSRSRGCLASRGEPRARSWRRAGPGSGTSSSRTSTSGDGPRIERMGAGCRKSSIVGFLPRRVSAASYGPQRAVVCNTFYVRFGLTRSPRPFFSASGEKNGRAWDLNAVVCKRFYVLRSGPSNVLHTIGRLGRRGHIGAGHPRPG